MIYGDLDILKEWRIVELQEGYTTESVQEVAQWFDSIKCGFSE